MGRILELIINIYISEERLEPCFYDNSEYFQYSERVGQSDVFK